jgi:hypothetical protein
VAPVATQGYSLQSRLPLPVRAIPKLCEYMVKREVPMRTDLLRGLLVGFLMMLPCVAGAQTPLYGKTYGEWAASWVQWSEAGPVGANAIEDTTGEFCDEHQLNGPVWFLAGSFGTVGVERNCTIPKNRALFYPLIEGGWVDCPGTPDVDVPDAAIRNLLAGIFDTACQLTSTVDEVPIPSLQVLTVRAQTPKFTNVLPDNPVIAGACTPPLVGGRTGRRIIEGYWVMLPALSPGEHTLTLHGAVCDFSDPNSGHVSFENGVTYHLTVTGK